MIQWGALIKGAQYGLGDPPWDMTAIERFEKNAGRKINILHFGLPWYSSKSWPYNYYPFAPKLFDTLRLRGITPLVDWASWDQTLGGAVTQPNFSLLSIIRGDHDAYLHCWAKAAAFYGYPFYLRLNWEMNGTWYPWSEAKNGNTHGEYILAWRHVHDIFAQERATNVIWIWCPNTIYSGSLNLADLYPGAPYVDYVGVDGYNWYKAKGMPWQGFYTTFKPTYDALSLICADKPWMIVEFGCNEFGDDGTKKTQWIKDALTVQLPKNFTRFQSALWFNWDLEGTKWTIESTEKAQKAFSESIACGYYL